jgi:diketogulonate reductase-like aldo/keto reductase
MLNWSLCRGCAVIPKSEKLTNQLMNIESGQFRLSNDEISLITKTCDKHQILLDGSVFNGYSLFA